MAVKQISSSVQNDGNFCLLDLKDENFNGNLMRIETYRSSHPSDSKYGKTNVGTTAKDLCGIDHLIPESNRIFRHIFSVEENDIMKVTLEIRERFEEDGFWEIRVRDLDANSDSFGYILFAQIKPVDSITYSIRYEMRNQSDNKIEKVQVLSPLKRLITSSCKGLIEIGLPEETLGKIQGKYEEYSINGFINLNEGTDYVDSFFAPFRTLLKKNIFSRWVKNIITYQRFGDFRDKCVHPGTNLIGVHGQLASEYLLIRAYRSSLIFLGGVVDPDMYMYKGTSQLDLDNPLDVDTKPGVYTPFLSAYILNIGVYQLGIDKVHSDYGGVPMKLKPGSRLENNSKPLVNSKRANQTLSDLAALMFQPQIMPLRINAVEINL